MAKQLTERQFDAMFNEGGEGYNPVRAAREAAEVKAEADRPVTLGDLHRQLEMLDCSIARESGTYDAEKIAAIRAQIEAIKAADEAKFIAAWPIELTMARRAEWNAFVRVNSTPKGIRADLVCEKVKAQGWTTDDLRQAVKLHNL